MNLVTDCWIPVVINDGIREDASLMQIFTEGEKYADLAVRPHERVALMRLLICIAQAALDGPADKDDWLKAPQKLPDAARMYLEKWNKEEVFELFHPMKPFMQIPDLKSKELTPTSKLDLFLSTGNMTTLFDHEANGNEERILRHKDIAVSLITFQCFSSGGGLPVTQWQGIKTGQVGNTDALCLTGGMYHTFFRGKTLIESICLNLLPKTTVNRYYGNVNKKHDERDIDEKRFWGKPVWEMMPAKPTDIERIENATHTYLGRLVPMCRWIKIENYGKGFHCGKGFDYPVMDRKVQKPKKNKPILPVWPAEPTASVDLNKENTERFVKGAKPDKAVWRELAAILIKRDASGIGGPLSFENPLPTKDMDIHVCALVRDQASIEKMVEAVYNISSKIFSEQGRSVYEMEVQQAEWIARKLGYAVETYRRNLDNFWDQRLEMARKDKNKLKAKLYAKATRSFWTTIEKQRHLLMACIDALDDSGRYETALNTWRTAIHQAARDAFISACGQETPRQMRAFALGWKKLFVEKKEGSVEQNEEQNEDQNNEQDNDNEGGEE
ncbi:MAG TPA: type I-E CRISPR-associated protein Cse1/CasA [Alphaproteobacteria bacterium]|nr:type I-E CRISPR-associated protein Cse1/CasA [Alphaproteobacteria bacterium]